MITPNKRLVAIVFTVAILLLVPLVAMQFTQEVNWSYFDFVVAGGLLLSTGLMCEFIIRKVKKTPFRILICVGILTICLLVWIELAVGIFGSAFAGN